MPKRNKYQPSKKILFALEHFYPYIGGAEKLFYQLSIALANDGFEVVVITTRFDKTLPKEETHQQVKIVRINSFNRFAFTLLSLPKVIQFARRSDYIHTTTYNAALPAIIAGKLTRKPVFVTFHEVWGQLWKQLPFTSFLGRNAFYLFEKLLLKLPFHKFIAVSEFTRTALIEAGISSSKVLQIHNGIEYSIFNQYTPSPPPIFTFTYFGRLGISKGLDLLIPAAADFQKSFPQSKLKLIIPQYPATLYKRVIALIDQYKLGDYIEFHHNLPKVKLYQELLSSSCVVIPSYSEGFCFAAAETVALKVPIISSHQGALPEVVSGQFIPLAGMTAADLSRALEEAYHQNWKEKPIKHYHLKDTIAAYTGLYKLQFTKSI